MEGTIRSVTGRQRKMIGIQHTNQLRATIEA
jgi:hypothetical protein